MHVSPRDLLIRALAQVPLPRKPSIRYHVNFAPNAADRPLVVPDAAKVSSGLAKRTKVKTRGDDETPAQASTPVVLSRPLLHPSQHSGAAGLPDA